MFKWSKQVWPILKGMGKRMTEADISLVAAGGAFFTMLSLFPALAAVIALIGFFTDPSVLDAQLPLLKEFIPADAYSILHTQISRLVEANNSVLGWTTVLTTLAALWSARRGTDAMIAALNKVYHVKSRGGLRSSAVAVLITFALIVVVAIALLSIVVLPIILAFFPLGGWSGVALDVFRLAVGLCVVITGIWVLYRFGPNRKHKRMPWITPGSLLAMFVWAALCFLFAYYLTNFGGYDAIYGSIGAVIALLMFLYITIFTVLLGAALNAELEEYLAEMSALETVQDDLSGLADTT